MANLVLEKLQTTEELFQSRERVALKKVKFYIHAKGYYCRNFSNCQVKKTRLDRIKPKTTFSLYSNSKETVLFIREPLKRLFPGRLRSVENFHRVLYVRNIFDLQ